MGQLRGNEPLVGARRQEAGRRHEAQHAGGPGGARAGHSDVRQHPRPACQGAAGPGGNADAAETAKKFMPVIKAAVNGYLDGAKRVITDSEGAFLGLTLSDQGLNATVAADFTPGSYMGNLTSKTKNTNADLMAGL